MADDLKLSDFTGGEKAQLAFLHVRMAKRGLAGDKVDISDLKRKVERVEDTARRRKNGK
ncbi:DUF6257 family protein [Streptomyces hokutonensis]|uniref:DUF6257 family protein n=1 Tax=Streptomyces hokutonensis TaxID=1306990 RepID=UPI0003603D1A|nr:DUF6257 family protein [Streptomyces hokutonensis]